MVSPQTGAQELPMQTVGHIIRAHRRRMGLTLQAVADRVGCTKGYLSAIENDRRERPPSEDLLARIESALRLEKGSLVFVGNWQETPDSVRRRVMDLETDRHLARRLARLLAREGVDRLHRSGELRSLVERLEDADRPADPDARRASVDPQSERGAPAGLRSLLPLQIPLINNVAAGYPRHFTDLGYPARVADDYVSVPDINDPDAFAARVVGTSMEPAYFEGDIVVFSPLAPTKDGSDCFVRFERDEESTFKRAYFEQTHAGQQRIRLQPLNPAFPPRTVDREEVAGLYAAVFVVRPLA